jgi:hypothetical protein
VTATADLVSVVIPVWEPHEPWLRAAVVSVLGQRNCTLECIVVDDGCRRSVAEMLTGVDDERLRIVRVRHAGVSAARDAGLAAARGQWIRYTDADDVLEPASTARLLRLARTGAIAYGATVFCDEALRPLWTMRCGLEGHVERACLLGRFTVRLPALLFPRAVVERTGTWLRDAHMAEDWDFILRALQLTAVRGESTPAVYYRRHAGGLTSHPDGGLRDVRLVVERYFARHPELSGTHLERRAAAMVHALGARVQATRGNHQRASRHLGSALATDPRAVVEESWRCLPALWANVPTLRHRRAATPCPPAKAKTVDS